MRRIGTKETLHGTRDGQLAVDDRLAKRFGLTERESACASLVKLGRSPREIADRLSVAPSTIEKHLVGLRRKLGVSTTLEAAVALLRLEDESTAKIPDAYGIVLPVSRPTDGSDQADSVAVCGSELRERLRAKDTIEEMLETLRDDLQEVGVEALFYFFLPLSAASFRKGEILYRQCASKSLIGAFRKDGGVTQAYVASRVFEEPDRAVLHSLQEGAPGEISQHVIEACRRADLTLGITVGSPFGTSYVVLTALCREQDSSTGTGETQREVLLRDRLVLLQNIAYSFGALARTSGLTTRERDALSLVAGGHSTATAATLVGSSERAFGQLLKSARDKLSARTTTEAVAQAMALNALVFL